MTNKLSQSLSLPFAEFAHAAERVRATTKRLEKAAVLAALFDRLSDADLVLAARFMAGCAFPMRDQRTTSVGGSALFSAVVAVAGAEPDHAMERYVALGDLGDLAEELLAGRTPGPAELTLSGAERALDDLASTSGSAAKLERVVGLLSGASALEAKYLVKLIGGDLRIGLQEGAVEDAIARWRGVEVGRVQWVNMLAGDIGETALLARRGELDSARMRLFHPIKFMLATPAADLADVARQMPESFVVEDKFDGIRAQAHIAPELPGEATLHGVVSGGVRVALFSRTLDEITESFPDLVPALAALVPADAPRPEESGLILDGELVPMRDGQILPFQLLQPRLGRKRPTSAILAASQVAFVAYDALYASGRILLLEPYLHRRQELERLAMDGHVTLRADSKVFSDVAALDAEFDAARARGNEGLMVKDPASPYRPGRRGRDWLKIKRALATLDVVVTAVEVGNGRRHNLLSDYTFAVRTSEDDPTLLNVGKAYSGLTDDELAALSTWFREHTLEEFAHGKVRTVEPKVVLEVTFDLVQPSSRHKSGYALRFPRIVRVRHDKPPDQIDTLETVRRLAVGAQKP